jgi:hypothetical protein
MKGMAPEWTIPLKTSKSLPVIKIKKKSKDPNEK